VWAVKEDKRGSLWILCSWDSASLFAKGIRLLLALIVVGVLNRAGQEVLPLWQQRWGRAGFFCYQLISMPLGCMVLGTLIFGWPPFPKLRRDRTPVNVRNASDRRSAPDE
jgi:hypothetical protein